MEGENEPVADQLSDNTSRSSDREERKADDKGAEDIAEHGDEGGDKALESLEDAGELNASQQLTDQERMVLFEKAVRFKRKGSSQHALHCFLGCLQGLKDESKFSALPQCLHHIAELYSADEDYGPAIQFAQAEKLYYETALLTAGISDLVDKEKEALQTSEGTGDSGNQNAKSEQPTRSLPDSPPDPQTQRADEFENLAHLCLKQKNTQLALEYCAKAVKVRQAHLGEHHPVTVRTLDLFTSIYAEMGKLQYSAALDKLSAIQKKDSEEKAKQKSDTTTERMEALEEKESGASRAIQKPAESSTSQTDQASDQGNASEYVQVTVTSSQALLLYFLITVIIGLVVTTVLCYYTQSDVHTVYTYAVTRLRYYYYYYFKPRAPMGNQYF